MSVLLELLPWLLAMAVLIVCSAFFSASEAAMFYLRVSDRRKLARGNTAQRAAARLLRDPDRLLSAILFWNLVVNMAYFAISSILSIRIEDRGAGQSLAVAFAIGSLLTIIFFSEMLPKSLAVLRASTLAAAFALPLSVAIRIVDPIMPALRVVNLLSRRLLWPGFKSESYLEINDVERVIEISTSDRHLLEQERAVLANIVALSEIRVDEWMRPRAQFRTFRPPVSLADLGGELTPSGYLLVTEPDNEEVSASLHLTSLFDLPQTNLEHLAEPVVIMPWCSTAAEALEQMVTQDRDVAAVVNEFGETIGILTYDDLLDTVFTYSPSRSKRFFDRNPIHDIGPNMWLVAGMTSLRRLGRYLNVEMPSSKSVTVGGIVQEMLGRLAAPGDECDWGPFHLKVLEAPQRGLMLLQLTRIAPREEERP
ncbi:MAG: CNNM domain-containing protein [Pirellulaceae bacterium]